MSDPILGPTEVWDTDALLELEDRAFGKFKVPKPFRCRTGAVPGTKGTSTKVLSYFVPPDGTADGVGQYYISPLVDESDIAIALLVRMASQAIFPTHDLRDRGYNPRLNFLNHVGLLDPAKPVPTINTGLRDHIREIVKVLGPRPHGKVLTAEAVRKTKSTALLKAQCPYNCPTSIHTTLTAAQRAWPLCAGNGTHQPFYLVLVGGPNTTNPGEHHAHHHFTTPVNADGWAHP